MTAKTADYGVRILHAYENKRVGQVIFPPALLRDRLLRARLVEHVAPPAESEGGLLARLDPRKSRVRK